MYDEVIAHLNENGASCDLPGISVWRSSLTDAEGTEISESVLKKSDIDVETVIRVDGELPGSDRVRVYDLDKVLWRRDGKHQAADL